jgi:Leucine-rich repeat (LRR) protein
MRTFVIIATLCAAPWLAVTMQQVRRERAAAASLEKLGAETVAWSAPSGPVWLRRLLGDGFFMYVDRVDVTGLKVSDEALENLKCMTRLRVLHFGDNPQITDTGIRCIKGLTQLEWLSLDRTQVTDAGLENVKGLRRLKFLDLKVTNVTDAGLDHIAGLNRLEKLDLQRTKITDAGLKKLKGLTQLRELYLTRPITPSGEKELKNALPKCYIARFDD